ncbi:SagB family peptide dehydrogenase [Bacillus sp. 1P06AnD]|uniref:SagB family peptide dehydrogenase n=1 Tax=Bacillus sp. 1P06AnD TaxID=3132208 RepID=UPI0039A167CC
MDLDTFLYNLQYESGTSRPEDWTVNWDDAPLPYKIYKNLPVIPLPYSIPKEIPSTPDIAPSLETISYFLWYSFGLTHMTQTLYNGDYLEPGATYRRFFPSGGGLYPNELYMYVKTAGIAEGIYHYDPAHHSLEMVREGNMEPYISAALGDRCELARSFGVLFISTVFWKNFFKYHDFSYRLQGLDAGFALGQLLETGKQFGFRTGVYYQFTDRAVNHLLGLSGHEESVYAMIPLSVDSEMEWFRIPPTHSSVDTCKDLPALTHSVYQHSKEIRDYPALVEMNEACMMDTIRLAQKKTTRTKKTDVFPSFPLPEVAGHSYDFAAASRDRHSPGTEFILKYIRKEELSILLHEAYSMLSYRNDIDNGINATLDRTSLYGCFYHVDGVKDGAYVYDSKAHALCTVKTGDYRYQMQTALFADFVNMQQIPLAFTIAGDQDHYFNMFGYRGYRIQQMEAGILSQSLLLIASSLGLSGHPLLGYDVHSINSIYQMDKLDDTSLIQLPIGFSQPPSRLTGYLSQ